MISIKFVVWGAGIRGRRIQKLLGNDRIVAFIDNADEKVGKLYDGIPVISFDKYLKQYSQYFIIVTPLRFEEILQNLEDQGVYQYFILDDCPSELQLSGNKNIIKEPPIQYNKNTVNGIYGINLFSVLLYVFLHGQGCSNLYLIPHCNVSLEMLDRLKLLLCDFKISSLEQVVSSVDNIYLTTDLDEEYVRSCVKEDINLINAYDFSYKIDEYYNSQMEKFKNIHEGKRCFIVATGPSLDIEDLEKLRLNNEICISMNRIHRIFEDTKWRPQYYVATDVALIESIGEEIKKSDIKYKFVADNCNSFWEEDIGDDLLKVHVQCVSKSDVRCKFSENPAYRIYEGFTVTYACLQLAAFMGFKEIYLVGVDFNYSNNREVDESHFCKDYYSGVKRINTFFPERNLIAYQTARSYANKKQIKIYNATRGGKLEIFTRVDFNSLFYKG